MIHLLFIIYIKEFLKDLVVSSKDFLKYYTCSYTSLWPEPRSRRFWHRSLWTWVGCLEFHDLHPCTSNHRDAIGTCNSWLCILKMKLKMLNSLRTTAIA